MTKLLRLLSAFLLLSNIAFAQSNSGEIYGRVTDEKKEGLDFASVVALEGGVVKGGGKTDINGNYKIKPLAPGKYDIKVTYVGYSESLITGVYVGNDKRVLVDIIMVKKVAGTVIKEQIITGYKNPLIKASDPGSTVKTKEQFAHTVSDNISTLIGSSAGSYQGRSGSSDININGARASNTSIMIDGMVIRPGRGYNIPKSAFSQFELMSNGLSAKYGNATGGIVSITTNGVSRQFGGSFSLQHSVEGYNTNLGSLDLSGPILRKKNKTGQKIPVLGFTLNLGVTYDKDGDPAYNKYDRLKPEVLKRIQDDPIIANPNGTGNFVRSAEQVTASDFEKVKARENGEGLGLTYIGKLDFQPLENLNVTLGTYAFYNKTKGWSFANSLFAPEANSINESFNGRGFIRLTQRLGKPASAEKQDAKKSPISDAFYTLQFTYQKEFLNSENPTHGRNIFDYGYVGKFTQHRTPFYSLGETKQGYKGQAYRGEILDSLTFVPGGINPLLENYTKAIYKDGRFDVSSINDISSYSGLRNGDGPSGAYGMWTGPGAQIGSYSYGDADIITLNLDASLDIEQGGKNKTRKDRITHNIQFGLGYDQRTSRSYGLAAAGLWGVMRQNTNRHIKNLNLANPHFWIGGVMYDTTDLKAGLVMMSPFDTIRYDPIDDSAAQSQFDRQLRIQLYGDARNKTTIDIDNLDPKTFSLNMFSADDLLNKGNDVVGYFGYDYLGKKLTRQPSFNDFWTKKDARGDFERPIAAFRPIYMFGYILDKFSYKDLFFNIGLRVDRYDANQKVLKDPYSLYGVRKVSDINPNTYSLAQDPEGEGYAPLVSSFDKDYVVYVDNNQSEKPKVVGYRKGDSWYDPFGTEIADPTILSGLYANGLPIEPWLVTRIDSSNGIKGKDFDPNNSFEDFKPQVTLSPRIQFTFPISENALFYGNYDVISQNPTVNGGGSINLATPDDYYFLQERQSTLNNANLKMEKAVKYSLGYQQRLSKKSAVTIETFYQERKNQIQVQQLLLAYPISYSSYGNRDFSSTVGTTLKLDFRRNGPIRMNIDYTLQFAEGTGSGSTSQRSLLNSGQPNLRTILPLDYDSRHILNVSFDYRYEMDVNGKEDKGPKIGKYYPFRNSGINLGFRSNSGTPYTRSSVATPLTGGDFNSTPFIGTINGSRLPWVYDFGLRIDKGFNLGSYGAKTDKEGKVIKTGKPLFLNVYSNIQNLFNTKNTLGVYRYTGVGDDDGYLTSPQGLQSLQSKEFRQAYIDLYNAKLVDPGKYNNPRRINIGFQLEF